MLERCNKVLHDVFGIAAQCVTEVKGGWSARAFRVEAQEGKYFLKVYDKEKLSVAPWVARIGNYMPVLTWLSRNTPLKDCIVQPVLAIDGRYKHEDERYVYVTFLYIDGHTVGIDNPYTPTQVYELGRAVALLHSYGAEVSGYTSRLEENISLPFCTNLRAFLQHAEPCPESLTNLMRPHEGMLSEAIRYTEHLRDTVRRDAPHVSLCHTDLHGNNLMQAEHLVLVDWEDLCLAPPEADLFMFAGAVYWEDVLAAYRTVHPEFRLDEAMLAFYRLRRRMDDIWYFIARVIYDDPSNEEVEIIYNRLRRQFSDTEELLRQFGKRDE